MYQAVIYTCWRLGNLRVLLPFFRCDQHVTDMWYCKVGLDVILVLLLALQVCLMVYPQDVCNNIHR